MQKVLVEYISSQGVIEKTEETHTKTRDPLGVVDNTRVFERIKAHIRGYVTYARFSLESVTLCDEDGEHKGLVPNPKIPQLLGPLVVVTKI